MFLLPSNGERTNTATMMASAIRPLASRSFQSENWRSGSILPVSLNVLVV